jgi:hypothetical protein
MESPGMEKPIIDVNTRGDDKLIKKRKKAWKRQLKEILNTPKKEKRKVSEILHTWRKKQRKLLDSRDIEDPDPFVQTYVFYCLNM